jgi:hypothetical protein
LARWTQMETVERESWDRDGDGKNRFWGCGPRGHKLLSRGPTWGFQAPWGMISSWPQKGIKDPQGREISLQKKHGEPLFSPKAIGSKGFFYDTMAGDSAYGTVLSGRVSLGEPSLPHGLFDEGGLPREAYFEGIPMKEAHWPHRAQKLSRSHTGSSSRGHPVGGRRCDNQGIGSRGKLVEEGHCRHCDRKDHPR